MELFCDIWSISLSSLILSKIKTRYKMIFPLWHLTVAKETEKELLQFPFQNSPFHRYGGLYKRSENSGMAIFDKTEWN
jgi:hypothetical protein